MSYWFELRAATKAAAKQMVTDKLTETAANQPSHAHDKAQATAAAHAFIDLLPEDPNKDVEVKMAGWVNGTWDGTSVTALSGANVSVTASLVARVG